VKNYNFSVCGGLITSSPGNITSPGFATGNYTNNIQCIWTIRNQAYVNTSIVIRFNTLKLEPAHSCRYDWLEAREGLCYIFLLFLHGICDQHGSRSAFASAQSDQDPCCLLTNSIISRETDSEQHGSCSDCAEAQAGLDPSWSQSHYVGFVYTCTCIWSCSLLFTCCHTCISCLCQKIFLLWCNRLIRLTYIVDDLCIKLVLD
jgi:hypothetical protein